jgi:hypothetical protein
VKRFWQDENHDVEAELRKYRPEPGPTFLAALSEGLQERMRRPKSARRAALVAALTVGMLTVFATFGGIGYASSAAGNAIHISKIEHLVGISQHSQSAQGNENDNNQGDNDNQGEDQYRPGMGCGDKNHIHSRHNECKHHGNH